MKKPVVILLPRHGYDPSEAAVTWQVLNLAGEDVRFATPEGEPASPDPMMVSGVGLDLWGWVPLLRRVRLLGLILRADSRARRAHRAMVAQETFRRPMRYSEVSTDKVDGLVLPGGHAKTMRPYLEDVRLQSLVADALASGSGADDHLPVAAICHGVLVLARARGDDSLSPIARRRVTALTWKLESTAWRLGRIFRFWDPHYYRTYLEQPGEPTGFWGVQQEVSRALANPAQFLDVPADAPDRRRKTDGLHRDSPGDARPAWVVRDGNLVTARWPGDVHTFAGTFVDVLRTRRDRAGEQGGERATAEVGGN